MIILRKSKKSLPSFDILIHTAALAHGQKPSKNKSLVSYNVKITENLLKYFEDKISHIIFTSSVSVYGEDKRFKAVTISDRLRPSTLYGLSKVICEQKIISSKIEKYSILRLSPVFDKNNKIDVKKRVYIPFFDSWKMLIIPSPKYSLTKIETLVEVVLKIIEHKKSKYNVYNIADKNPYSQNELVGWFPGKKLSSQLFS